MITEDYVSFETAKLLKEKGFEYNPDESYWLIDTNNVMYWVSEIGAYDYVDVPTESFQRPKNGYRLVTQATAMKWLREVHNIAISVYVFNRDLSIKENGIRYTCDIATTKISSKEGHLRLTGTYEEVCEAAIKYCLEKLI